jgi:hypothetical protein
MLTKDSIDIEYGEGKMGDRIPASIATSGGASAFVELTKRPGGTVFKTAIASPGIERIRKARSSTLSSTLCG